MADIEKVIKCLELCRKLTDSCEGCPYENVPPIENCMLTMHDDALALLKEQEAVEPNPVHNSYRWFACGKCDCSITREDRFCPRCGQAVKWE